MKLSLSSNLVILAMGLSIASAGLGFVPQKNSPLVNKSGGHLGHLVVRPDLTESIRASKAGAASFGIDASVKVDRNTKAVRVITDPGVSVLKEINQAGLERACLGFVSDHQDYFGRVTPKNLELNKDALLLSSDMQFLKYRVYYKGILVQDANIDCRFKQGKLVQVVNMSFSEARELKGSPQKGLQAIVKDAFAVDSTNNRGQVYRVVAENNGYKLVLTDVFRINKNGEPYDIQIETNTGKVLEQRPLHHYIDGRVGAQIYERWWQDDLIDVGVANATVETRADSVRTDATGRFVAAADSAPRLAGFKGPQVDVRATTGGLAMIDAVLSEDIYSIQQLRETTGEMYSGKQTSQAMIFHHTNLIVDRARLYLTNDWFDSPLVANANLGQTCNAHWDGTTINFYSAGNNCANTGLISDVVYHEWGHGLDANTGGIDDGAFSEGFGDIMSVIFTHSNILGIGFRTDGSEVRDLEPDKVYPDDANQEVHAEGLIIASTFWDLWKALVAEHGEETADELLARYSFNVIVAATRYTDAYEALKVIDDNDGFLGNGTPNLCLINEVFQAHGLAGEEAACLMGELDASMTEAAGNGNGIIEPGEQINIDVSLFNTTDADQASVTGSAALGLTVDGVTITQAELDFGNIAAGTSATSSMPIVVEVADQTVCGAQFDVVYDVTSAEREAKFKTTYQVGRKIVGDAEMVQAAGLPLPVTDLNTTVTSVMFNNSEWTDYTPVDAARLKFDITHTYRGDLTVTLTSPAGDSYEIYKGAGASSDVHFDEDISAVIGGALGKGEWKLSVYDGYSADEGTLDLVELKLTPARFECE